MFVFVLCCAGAPTKSDYAEVEATLRTLDMYEPVLVNEFAPEYRFRRRHWIEKMALQFPVMLYRVAYGSNLGTSFFLWKSPAEIDQTAVSRTMSRISAQHKFFATRSMCKDFFHKYCSLCQVPKAVLRNMYKSLVEDTSASSCAAEKEVDDRIAQAALDLDDTDIILDLRKLNGNPQSSKFDDFWQALDEFLEESMLAVDDRRHRDILHMPVAISVRHLRETVVERLEKKFPGELRSVPSEEWIRLQFCPSNPFANSALRHTGRINIKLAVQAR